MSDEVPLTLSELCSAHELELLDEMPPGTGSVFVARVRTRAGKELLLKRGNGIRGNFEGRVSKAWEGDESSPGSVRVLDEHTFLRDWIVGEALGHDRTNVGAQLRATGRAMRRLHAARPPAGVPDLRSRFSPEGVLGEWKPALPAVMLSRAAELAAELHDDEPPNPVLVHGDLVPANVLVGPSGGVVVIDPVGFVGTPSRDLAQLAVALEGRDRRRNLDDVLAGYGTRPPLVEAAFEWLAYMFLEKNLELEQENPGSRTSCVRELSQLADGFARP